MRNLQDKIARLNTYVDVKYLEGTMIRNCSITRAGILRAGDIFGPDLVTVKAKTTRHNMYS